MTSPKNPHTKNVTNELSFPLVTHMTHFGKRFGRYGILNTAPVLDRLRTDWIAFVQSGFNATKWVKLARV
jgi:hypothetical protein